MEPTRVAVIGSSGRTADAKYVNYDIYTEMYTELETLLTEIHPDPNKLTLVANGRAFANHLAISAFLKNRRYGMQLELHFASIWDVEDNQFIGAHTAKINEDHRRFCEGLGLPPKQSLKTIGRVLNQYGVRVKTHDTVKEQNLAIGKVDAIIAFTAGVRVPSTAHTKHIWKHSKASDKMHVSLRDFT